jgi:hypothetical protein
VQCPLYPQKRTLGLAYLLADVVAVDDEIVAGSQRKGLL